MPELTIDIDGPVHVVDHGGSGPAMVLVHGLGGSLLDWRDVAEPLTRGHHVWSLDLVGFGRTPLAGRSATLQANQALVDRLIARIAGDVPVVLVGNSMGGLISVLEASRRPQRVGALVLVDPALPMGGGSHVSRMITASFMVMSAPRLGPWMVDRHTRRRGAERLVDDVLRLCTADCSRVSAATREAQVALTEWRQRQDQPHRAFVEATRSLVQWLWHRDVLERHLRAVQAPTLLVHGDQDRLVGVRASAAVASMRPDWTFHVLADTGHIPQIERPQEFVALVEGWLAERQPAATSCR